MVWIKQRNFRSEALRLPSKLLQVLFLLLRKSDVIRMLNSFILLIVTAIIFDWVTSERMGALVSTIELLTAPAVLFSRSNELVASANSILPQKQLLLIDALPRYFANHFTMIRMASNSTVNSCRSCGTTGSSRCCLYCSQFRTARSHDVQCRITATESPNRCWSFSAIPCRQEKASPIKRSVLPCPAVRPYPITNSGVVWCVTKSIFFSSPTTVILISSLTEMMSVLHRTTASREIDQRVRMGVDPKSGKGKLSQTQTDSKPAATGTRTLTVGICARQSPKSLFSMVLHFETVNRIFRIESWIIVWSHDISTGLLDPLATLPADDCSICTLGHFVISAIDLWCLYVYILVTHTNRPIRA